MSNIPNTSNLSFFTVMQNTRQNRMKVDFSNLPRPYYVMCFDIAGDGVFTPENGDESVEVHPGDIIFIPASTQYISERTGHPTISHIGIHFLFENNNVSMNQNDYKMQTVNIGDYDEVYKKFEFVYKNFQGSDEEQYAAIAVFYEILSRSLSQLKRKRPKKIDTRIDKAISYIDKNYTAPISISELASISKMSPSYFHSCFKESIGMSPIEYKHKVCVEHSIILLLDTEKRSIEEISDMLGFSSSIYFRRIFKKITGMSPKSYQKSIKEV